MTDYSIDVVLIEYENAWSAQCLQYDIGAQGKTLDDAVNALNLALAGHIVIASQKGVKPFSNLEAAPKKYWKLWEGATVKIEVDDGAKYRVPDFVKNFALPSFAYRAAACPA